MADPARRREEGEGCVFYAVPTTCTLRLRMQLQLYQRDHCHLCDLALAVLAAARAPEFASVWIDGDPVLEARYGARVPVLRDAGDGRELGWPFDAAAVRRFLADGAA